MEREINIVVTVRVYEPMQQIKDFYYLSKIIQEFRLVKSCRGNHHSRSAVAQIWSYDFIVEH